jgi:hypothetical protein
MEKCNCGEHKEPIKPPQGGNRPGRLWRVLTRHQSVSAFNGYEPRWSAFSNIGCLRCGAHWRTKAKYVDDLQDIGDRWPKYPFGPQTPGYEEEMENSGRDPVDWTKGGNL